MDTPDVIETVCDDKPDTLESLCDKGRHLLHETHHPSRTHREFKYWDDRVAGWLDKHFPNSGFSAEWSSLSTSPLVIAGGYYDDPESWAVFRTAVQCRLAWLGKFGTAMRQQKKGTKASKTGVVSNRVFVVHGRNEALREKVARFLEKLGLVPIILHEKPNKGRTIIEKFTDYADVSYTVVLLTADDIGGLVGTGQDDLTPRARQNVVFELGYFLGRLGREKVCALYENGVEVLSDYSGVLYITLDSHDAWRLQLAKEMKAAGLPVDMNRAL